MLAAAVPTGPGVWADIGAGGGTFTRALAARLGPGARIYAVDHDAHAIAALHRWADRTEADVLPVEADFARPFDLPGVTDGGLDGMLLANALHYVPSPGPVLARLATLIRPGGRVVIAEYDGRSANRWVPYPLPIRRVLEVAAIAGLTPPVVTATRRSAFGGTLYVACASRL